jgi:putative transcriptional regulator
MSNAGSRILRSVRSTRAYACGEATEGFVAHVPEGVDVKAIRESLGLSQGAFAERFGLIPAAIRDWEQHRRQPDPTPRVLLLVIAHDPDAVEGVAARRGVRPERGKEAPRAAQHRGFAPCKSWPAPLPSFPYFG